MTAAALVEEAEEASEDRTMGDAGEDGGRQTPEVVMTEAMPDPVKESPKAAKKVDKTVVPKMRSVPCLLLSKLQMFIETCVVKYLESIDYIKNQTNEICSALKI